MYQFILSMEPITFDKNFGILKTTTFIHNPPFSPSEQTQIPQKQNHTSFQNGNHTDGETQPGNHSDAERKTGKSHRFTT